MKQSLYRSIRMGIVIFATCVLGMMFGSNVAVAQSPSDVGECYTDSSYTTTYGQQTYADCTNMGGEFVAPSTSSGYTQQTNFEREQEENKKVMCTVRGYTMGPMRQKECTDRGGVVQPGSPDSSTEDTTGSPSWWDNLKCYANPFDCALRNLVAMVATTVLGFASLLTALSGLVLNGVIYETVVHVSDNYEKLTAIDESWKVIRDVSNMAFIFVLLYASIRTILGVGQDTQKLIVRIVVVAILINFSLFFTKFVIDVSNVLALTFYDAIVPGAAAQGLTDVNITAKGLVQAGLSDAFMQNLDLTSLYTVPGGTTVTFGKIITTGIMGTIMLLVASFVFFAVALMFIIRYVILIMVLILSPIAFIAFILPQAEEYRKQWLDALIGQAFFAPIYMMLTWVTVKILGGINSGSLAVGDIELAGEAGAVGATMATQGFAGTLINFIVVIVFLIASLIISKKWADKAQGVKGLTSWATGFAGNKTLGFVGSVGRNTIGSKAATMANDEGLKKRAAEGNMWARLQLSAAGKASKGSFDLRGTGFGGNLQAGKASNKGGYEQDQKDRAKKYGQYKPSDGAKKAAAAQTKNAEAELNKAKAAASSLAANTILKPHTLTVAEKELEEAKLAASTPSTLVGISDEDRAQDNARKIARVEEAERMLAKEKSEHDAAVSEFIDRSTAAEKRTYDDVAAVEKEMTKRMENMATRLESSWHIPGIMASGKDKANAVRSAAKEKSKKEKLADLSAEVAKEEAKEAEEAKPEKEGGDEKKEE